MHSWFPFSWEATLASLLRGQAGVKLNSIWSRTLLSDLKKIIHFPPVIERQWLCPLLSVRAAGRRTGPMEGRESRSRLWPPPGCLLLMTSPHACRASFPTYLMLFSLSATFSGTLDGQTSGFPHSRKAPGGGWLGKPWLSDRCDTRLPPPLSRPPGD